MKSIRMVARYSAALTLALMLGACAGMRGGGDLALTMTGAEEVPPVTTSASGTGSVRVADDRTVTGTFRTQGGPFVAAHIHEGAAGQNGPVIIPLEKRGDNEWAVPANAKLTEAQYESFRAGRLYVNFHSAKFKGGEIRAQIRPSGAARSGGG